MGETMENLRSFSLCTKVGKWAYTSLETGSTCLMEKLLNDYDFDMWLFLTTLTRNELNHSHNFMMHFK